ncbi:hypothetical protein GCM10023176_58780 [Micromonospora coerulea]|uniref:Uncharacterized protein n=1 Tax=Micromonospora coerulea TaxID=47856 RepID=A0ABP8T4F2_9ACTN
MRLAVLGPPGSETIAGAIAACLGVASISLTDTVQADTRIAALNLRRLLNLGLQRRHGACLA